MEAVKALLPQRLRTTLTAVIQMLLLLWLLLPGAPKVNPVNYTQPNGFLPFGFGGVVKAASSVFFA
jgi:hypothetical protein